MSVIDAEMALPMCRGAALMASPGEAFHTLPDRSKRDGKCVHFHTRVAPLAHLLLISDSSSSPLIRDSGAVGSPEISGFGQIFSIHGGLSPAALQ